MNLTAVKKAIQTQLRAHSTLRQLVTREQSILLHAGKFTWQELKRRSFTAPAIFISHLGFRTLSETQRYEFDEPLNSYQVRFAIGIVAKHAKGTEARNQVASAISEQLALIIANNNWGLPTVGSDIEKLEAQGLFVPAAEEDGQSLWLITWYQAVQIEETDWDTELDIFEGFDGEHQVGHSQSDYVPPPPPSADTNSA